MLQVQIAAVATPTCGRAVIGRAEMVLESEQIERLGIAHEAYINGRPLGCFPQDPELLLKEVEIELAEL